MFVRPHCFLSVIMMAVSAEAQETPKPTRAVQRSNGNAPASFAVAAIKLHPPDAPGGGFTADGERFTIRNETIAKMMYFAYNIHPRQVVNAPESMLHEAYDIVGMADTEGEPNLRQQQEMIQKLLAERFHLRLHREQRELPVYVIEVAKGGPKLKPTVDPDARPDWTIKYQGAERTYGYTNASISVFMMGEQFVIDRPMVDRTGLKGHYDFYLRYNSDEMNAGEPGSAPGFFTAVQEQLGLKFVAAKAATEVLVIDHVEKPTEN